jgi:cytochrome c peroxidase
VWFWDGRASSLLEQARGPMTNPVEMAATPEHVVLAVSRTAAYRRYFREAFGDDGATLETVAEAIAA